MAQYKLYSIILFSLFLFCYICPFKREINITYFPYDKETNTRYRPYGKERITERAYYQLASTVS